ncbi:hypothetical protein LCGC14_1733290 [marine sediment metagenome]|uniref:Uncharacterized protein n=1 Tax=marine sediment metagenome TaxID=412755 RepID=A0A0F9JPB2_9ZZZZ
MNITDIVIVSPVNPAHGRHEVHARTNDGLDVAFSISPEALGSLTGYFDSFPKLARESDKKKGS